MLVNNAVFNALELPLSAEDSSQTYGARESGAGIYDDMGQDCSVCNLIRDYDQLTHEMIEEIKFLRAEVVRWRQVLTKYLPPRWANGLRQDIYDNVFQNFEDYAAYQTFVRNCCNGLDPLDNAEQSAFLARLRDGTDETSINYL
ncbi:MAG: potassium channel protein [Oscillospiraceae bacterium]|nr:potassium channel protein [Oscillospiraceae bacterium]